MEDKQKILLCGDVEGKFDALFSRVAAINTKSGPFDALFCVGNFFGANNSEFFPYKSGEKKVPITTYILGPNSEEQARLYLKDDSEPVAQNIYCLGKRGLYVNSKGLKVAYISGVSSGTCSDYEYTNSDVQELYEACIRGNPSFRGVDILLTSQWSTNITEKSNNLAINKPSDCPAWLTMKLKPRYHICGLEGLHYERPPFRCPTLGDHDTTLDTVTRFIGLARVGNPYKAKWLYALSLTPLDRMKLSELMQKTTDETDCPFSFEDLEQKLFNKKKKSASGTQYFYDTTVQEESTSNRRHKRQKIEFDRNKCWFCLASPTVEKHLIVTVGNFTYLALAKGGLVEEHFLICPIEHHQSSLNQSEDIQQETDKFKEAVRKFYERNNHVPVFFERNYKTSHMQLQVVPIPKSATRELTETFMDEAEARGFRLQLLNQYDRLEHVSQPNVPFFTAELPSGAVLFTRVQGGSFPLNFGREVLAHRSILNLPDRIEWKDCVLKMEEEEKLVGRIRREFGPFDFTE